MTPISHHFQSALVLILSNGDTERNGRKKKQAYVESKSLVQCLQSKENKYIILD